MDYTAAVKPLQSATLTNYICRSQPRPGNLLRASYTSARNRKQGNNFSRLQTISAVVIF